MAISAVTHVLSAVKRAINKIKNRRESYPNIGNGAYLVTGYKDVVAADYDVAGDIIELVEFPPDTYLIGCSVQSDKDYDVGGTALRTDLILDDSVAHTFTSAVGSAFTNQPNNDGVEIVSDAAGDTTQVIRLIGTTTATDAVVVEDVTLNGTTFVATSKLNWGVILSAQVLTGTLTAASTVTIREASADQPITTLTPAITSRGLQAVDTANQPTYNRLLDFYLSGSGTKQIGFIGTDSDGTVIYDSQTATGATVAQSNTLFQTLTYVLTGDLESSRTVTVTSTEQPLVASATAFSGLPLPINFNGASIDGSEFAVDVSGQTLSLRIAVAPTTANTGTVRFSFKCFVYNGRVSSL